MSTNYECVKLKFSHYAVWFIGWQSTFYYNIVINNNIDLKISSIISRGDYSINMQKKPQ